MALDELLNNDTLTDLLYDSDDDMALILGAIKPWHLDGQPLSDDLEQWFTNNWNLECQTLACSQGLHSTTRYARVGPPTHPTC